MRALVQRVTEGSVSIEGKVRGQIEKGLVILLGITGNDTEEDALFLAGKCANLRIFSDREGKFNLSCLEEKGEILVISQFTLYGDTRKGRRPSFIHAAPPEISEPLYRKFIDKLKKMDLKVEEGVFGARMKVKIYNDGPVTLMVESKGI
ncbi:D-tyrosyl-tRNA(Tyr) deacylase [candidate division KSB1 bacterium]|nr:D-tyrosyl-tRNA(Tyr) deacylase [candidate division KSB1 bacterium]